jgi:hypothetical protein
MEALYVQNHCDWVYLPAISRVGQWRDFWLTAIEQEGRSPWIEKLIPSLSFLDVELLGSESKAFEPGFIERQYRFRAKVTELPESGTYTGTMTIPNYEMFELPVFCRTKEFLVASPPALFASCVSGEDLPELVFKIISGSSDVRVKGLEMAAPEGINVERKETESDQELRFGVSFREKALSSDVLGEITIAVETEESTNQIRIPLCLSFESLTSSDN